VEIEALNSDRIAFERRVDARFSALPQRLVDEVGDVNGRRGHQEQHYGRRPFKESNYERSYSVPVPRRRGTGRQGAKKMCDHTYLYDFAAVTG
jgi:hypothetical protein